MKDSINGTVRRNHILVILAETGEKTVVELLEAYKKRFSKFLPPTISMIRGHLTTLKIAGSVDRIEHGEAEPIFRISRTNTTRQKRLIDFREFLYKAQNGQSVEPEVVEALILRIRELQKIALDVALVAEPALGVEKYEALIEAIDRDLYA